MTSREPDFDSLVDALRSDLPSASDERRVRRRLLAAGIGVATAAVAPGAAATGLAGGSSFPVALLQKFAALSWMTKVGLAGVAVTAALPAAVYLTSAKQDAPPVEVATQQRHVQPRAASPKAVAKALPVSDPSVPAVAATSDSIPAREPARATPQPVAPPTDPAGADAPLPSGRASSAAFPTDESDGARDRSTLGEETVLVERALYALRRGDRESARRALEEHARRFPNGLLARERDRALSRVNAVDEPTGR